MKAMTSPTNKKRWAIKHRESGMFFGGFHSGPEFSAIWLSADKAKSWDQREIAVSQALLLRRFNNAVQLTPVLS
jgi:hypothetical protein